MILILRCICAWNLDNSPIIKDTKLAPSTHVLKWKRTQGVEFIQAKNVKVGDSLMETCLFPEVYHNYWVVDQIVSGDTE